MRAMIGWLAGRRVPVDLRRMDPYLLRDIGLEPGAHSGSLRRRAGHGAA